MCIRDREYTLVTPSLREWDVASATCGRSVHSEKVKSRPGWKTLLDFCSDLMVGHFVGLFQTDDMFRQSFTFQALLEFVLSHFWSKDLDLHGVTKLRDDLVII